MVITATVSLTVRQTPGQRMTGRQPALISTGSYALRF